MGNVRSSFEMGQGGRVSPNFSFPNKSTGRIGNDSLGGVRPPKAPRESEPLLGRVSGFAGVGHYGGASSVSSGTGEDTWRYAPDSR